MRKLLVLLFVLLALPLYARATLLIDTGTPDEYVGSWILGTMFDGYSQNLAQRFELNQSWIVDGLCGYFDPFCCEGGTATIALYGDVLGQDPLGNPGTVPGTGREYYHGRVAIGETKDWYGITGVKTVLDPGAYWIAYEIRSGDTFYGGMPDMAPYPLPGGAWTNQGVWVHNLNSVDPLDLGVRVDAQPVPEPASFCLLGGGLLGVLGFAKRRSFLRK